MSTKRVLDKAVKVIDAAIKAKSLTDLISKLEKKGYKITNANHKNWIYMEKNGWEYEAEYNKYYGGDFELPLSNIAKTRKL